MVAKKVAALAISEAIRNDILRGEFRAEDPLRIRTLAQRFGTSDLPVREALWILQKDGLVENRPNAGAFVRRLSAVEISEGYEIRSALERLALLRTPESHAAALLSELKTILAELEELVERDDAIRYGDINRKFHQKLVSGSTNSSVLVMLDRLWSDQSAYRRVFTSNRPRIIQSHCEHLEIYAAFAAGDMEGTASLLEEHRAKAVRAALDSIVEDEPNEMDGTWS